MCARHNTAMTENDTGLLARPPIRVSDGMARSLGAKSARPQAAQPLPESHWVARSDLLAAVYSGHQFGAWAGQPGYGRALALVGSPQPVARETLQTAAVVTRVAPSFLRFGHLQQPFDDQPENDADAGFPPAWAQSLEISCSS